MTTFAVQEIQHDPRAFVSHLKAGEELMVVEGERVLAEVRPVNKPSGLLRPYGLCAGQFTVPADFDDPLPGEIPIPAL